ncbi:unnamed protein product [Pleuronectes platessa]|uniref:Uncharacterized protein n=1 Tax=Pleuronectes platessa TaxID=8262 RepID=A0A9N7UBF6_PLEPL|nr:unnamed protein product [Pleuronectes platessa]
MDIADTNTGPGAPPTAPLTPSETRAGYQEPVPIWYRFQYNQYLPGPKCNADFGASFWCLSQLKTKGQCMLLRFDGHGQIGPPSPTWNALSGPLRGSSESFSGSSNFSNYTSKWRTAHG